MAHYYNQNQNHYNVISDLIGEFSFVEWSAEFEKKEPLPISLFEIPVLVGKE